MRRAGVERVGDDFSENGLLERTGVGITKVFEKMLQIDSRFTHGNILSGDPAIASLPMRLDVSSDTRRERRKRH